MKIGVLMYTFNRIDDARINMEIIRDIWSKNNLLKDITIVHTFNGQKDWWPNKYLEDDLAYLENTGHFSGAESLINAGMAIFAEKYPDLDYIIILAPDTWIIKPNYIEKVLSIMQKEDKYLATCPWGTTERDNMWEIGMAIDFCILNAKWTYRSGLFPLRLAEFSQKYSELFLYNDDVIYLERVFAMRFKQAIERTMKIPSEFFLGKVAREYVYRMRDREPVHDEKKYFGIFGKKKGRKMYWENIGLITHHEPDPKKEILINLNLSRIHGENSVGEYMRKLMEADDLEYYNQNIRKNAFIKGDRKVEGD